jgi:hypothetical protein
MTPEFSFVTWPGIFPPSEDNNAIWSDYTDNIQSSAAYDPFLGGLVSMVLSGISKVTHVFMSQDVHNADPFGSPSYDGAAFSNADATSLPAPRIYMEDFISNLDEVHEVSIHYVVLTEHIDLVYRIAGSLNFFAGVHAL